VNSDLRQRDSSGGTGQAYDLLLQGGRVIDPDSGRDGRFDVAFVGDRVAAIEARIDPGMASRAVPMDGAMVVPGLIDVHAHVCDGIGSAISPEEAVLAWLHISTIGLIDTRIPECLFLSTMNVEEAVAMAKANPDTIVGFKARLSSYVTGGGTTACR